MSTAQAQDVPFTDLQAGDRARLVADTLRVDDRDTLAALGLTKTSPFRVARAGDPWIVHVRATRIGLSAAVARCLRVVPI